MEDADGKVTPPLAPFGMRTPEDARLSGRELNAICLLSCGLSTLEIAKHLGIARKTVDQHRGSAVKKLGARNNSDLTRWCLMYGFIHLDGTLTE